MASGGTAPVWLEWTVALGPDAVRERVSTAADVTGYATDLELVYGQLPERDWLGPGEPISYPDLAAAAADRIGSGVDLVVTATPVPDCQARILPGCLLAHRLGGWPLLLGVTDQGAATGFTALRLAAGRIRSGAAQRAAVVVMEQPTLPPEPGCDLPRRARAAVIVLSCRQAGSHRLAEVSIRRTRPQAHPPSRTSFLAAWTGLARGLAGHPGGTVDVVDRDATLGYECRARFTPAAGPGGTDPSLEESA